MLKFTLVTLLFSLQVQASLEELLSQSMSNPQNGQSYVLSQSQWNTFKAGMKEIYDEVIEEEYTAGTTYPTGEAPFEPKPRFKDFFISVQDLYFKGYAKSAAMDQFKTRYEQLYQISMLPVPVDADGDGEVDLDEDGNPIMQMPDPVVFWWGHYSSMFDSFYEDIKNVPNYCINNMTTNATVIKCCRGLVKMTYVSPETMTTNKKKTYAACEEDEECFSGFCEIDEINEQGKLVGKCQTRKHCYVPQALGGACSEQNPYCVKGNCTKIDYASTGLGECKEVGDVCSGPTEQGNLECCSGKCSVNNKCVESLKCLDCVKNGQTPKPGQACCPGYYLQQSTGRCKTNMPPMVPVIETSFLQKVINFIFPSAHAQVPPPPFTDGQQELLEQEFALCQQEFTDPSDIEQCQDEAEQRLGTNFNTDNQPNLTVAQINQLDQARQACTDSHPAGSQAHKQCMAQVDALEQQMLAENEANGVVGGNPTAQDLINSERAPLVTGKRYSDIKQCEFHSFNDNWRDASLMEKNAEVFLRGFEFTFSNQGTQDYWWDSNAANENIFTRANKVARQFRENRGKMLIDLAEIDRQMSCKCIAVFGPSQFNAQKQQFFDQNCEAEKALLATNLITEVGKDATQDGQASNIERTNLENIEGEETTEQKMEEVDKGAIGLTHERLLIEWLGLRRDAQLRRFIDNSELEVQLNDLAAFVENKDFNEVWKDKYEGALVRNTPDVGDTVALYQWYFKRPSSFLAILIIVVVVVVSVLVLGPAGLALVGALVALAAGAFGGGGEPGAFDHKYDEKCGVFTCKEYFVKYYIGPRFDNKSPNQETRCEVYAKASTCVRSAYVMLVEDMQYLDEFNGNQHYILDPKLPLYVDPAKIEREKMPGYTMTLPQMWNKVRDMAVGSNGVMHSGDYGGGSASSAANLPQNFSSPQYLKRTAYKRSKNFAENDYISKARDNGYIFFLEKGAFNAVKFDNSYKNAIINAAKKYARCTFMQPDIDPVCGFQGAQEFDMGFGYLFETDAEALDFAKYAYEMHYIFSSITTDDQLGYPLMGAEAYYRMVAYNMKLLGSIAAARTNKYAEVYDLYVADWEKRVGEYTSLGEGTNGTQSVNTTYSPAFFDLFGRFTFNGNDNISDFETALNTELNGGKKFNKAELNALGAAKNKAIRTNGDLKKRQEYVRDTKNLKGQKLRVERQNNALARINQPLSSFGNGKLGGPFGFKKLNNTLGELNKSIDTFNRNNKKKKGAGSLAANPFVLPDFGNSAGSMGRFGGVGSTSSKDMQKTIQNDQGLSANQANNLINRLKDDDSLKEVTENDTLFTIVSKAYKRNYGRVLVRNTSSKKPQAIPEMKVKKEPGLAAPKKRELKQLLSQ